VSWWLVEICQWGSKWLLNDFFVDNVLRVKSTCTGPSCLCCTLLHLDHFEPPPWISVLACPILTLHYVDYLGVFLEFSLVQEQFLFLKVRHGFYSSIYFLVTYFAQLDLIKYFVMVLHTHTHTLSLSLAFLNPASLFLQRAFFISYFKMSIFHLGKACRKVQKGTNLRLVGTYFSSFYVTISAAPDLDLSAHLPLLDYARYIVSYTSIYRTFVRIFANVNSGLISASSIDGMRIGLLLPSHSFLI